MDQILGALSRAPGTRTASPRSPATVAKWVGGGALSICILDSIIFFMILSMLMPAARWRLLRALWRDNARGSVRALARQTRLSYSTAYSELKRLEQASLARSRAVGNALVFEASRDHPLVGAIEALMCAPENAESPETEVEPNRVLANLASLGAPVHSDSDPDGDLNPEEMVAQGLRLVHGNPALARAYPVLLARNRSRLDLERLRQRATELKEKQTLGFFLDLTGTLANDRHLRAFAQTLKDRRVKKVREFFEGPHGKYSRRLADQRTPQVARDWHFRMNMDMDNFRTLYSKFCETS